MFQEFTATSSPEQGPPRVAALREEMAADGLSAFLVPRADVHQGEYVAPHDERLAWLTGFTGSAGFAAVLTDRVGLFVDGRYTLQARTQVATDLITPVAWPATRLGPWLAEALEDGAEVGFDPWLHTVREIEDLRATLALKGIELVETMNLVDRIWADQPAPPAAPIQPYPVTLAGRFSSEKRAEAAEDLRKAGETALILTLPDSIAWLLNIRGADIAHTPVAHAFCILYDTGRAELFVDPAKAEGLRDHLGDEVALCPADEFPEALGHLEGPVRLDRDSVPYEVARRLEEAAIDISWAGDPCILRKACKTPAEIAATRAAHLRDGAAVCRFLHWLETQAEGLTRSETRPTEIDVVRALEGFRAETGELKEISFDTISGAGPNGAIVHYRVTEDSNRPLSRGELMLVDSGAQYLDGTTDITRTIAIGQPSAEARACFTRVLKGMIAMSRAVWPAGLAGRDLDALARMPLWMAGQDYDHGTGHGVGVYLGVHEGPQRLSRISEVPLRPGMILSNEPGYYREGSFGIRIENLLVVETADLPGADAGRDFLRFSTLTYAPIDRRLINAAMLSGGERDWLNAYHAEVAAKLADRVEGDAAAWLARATAPI